MTRPLDEILSEIKDNMHTMAQSTLRDRLVRALEWALLDWTEQYSEDTCEWSRSQIARILDGEDE